MPAFKALFSVKINRRPRYFPGDRRFCCCPNHGWDLLFKKKNHPAAPLEQRDGIILIPAISR